MGAEKQLHLELLLSELLGIGKFTGQTSAYQHHPSGACGVGSMPDPCIALLHASTTVGSQKAAPPTIDDILRRVGSMPA